MTKTIFGKRLLILATIVVLVSGLMMSASFDDAEAKKSKTGDHKLKCKSIGSWFPPTPEGVVTSSSEGKCSAGLGKVTSASITMITSLPDTDGCITLMSDPANPSFSMGKKGFIMYTTASTQCFWDETGTPTGPSDWCAPGGAHTSKVTGTYTILVDGGIVKKTSVVGGTGDFVSMANHCDDDAPYGNSFTTKLEGTIVFS
jgi:hypothetical protein